MYQHPDDAQRGKGCSHGVHPEDAYQHGKLARKPLAGQPDEAMTTVKNTVPNTGCSSQPTKARSCVSTPRLQQADQDE
jgi:hypothetical protein